MKYNFVAISGEDGDTDNDFDHPFYRLGFTLDSEENGGSYGGNHETSGGSPSASDPNRYPTLDEMIQADPEGFLGAIEGWIKTTIGGVDPLPIPFVTQTATVIVAQNLPV